MEIKIGIFNIKYSFDDDTINITTIDNDSTIEYTEQNNALIIHSNKSNYITEEELLNTDLAYSKIKKSEIINNGNVISNKTKYTSLLINIWKSMNIEDVKENTKFNYKLGNQNGERGFDYYPDLGISIQLKDSNNTMKEIIHMVKLNNYNMDISIELRNKKIINFKI